MATLMPEKKFYQWLVRKLDPKSVDCLRIETTTMSGIFDVNMADRETGEEIWVELKVRTHGRVLLRKEQFAWGMRRAFASCLLLALNDSDSLYIWRFPKVVVTPYQKYLSVVNPPAITCQLDIIGEKLKTILFTL